MSIGGKSAARARWPRSLGQADRPKRRDALRAPRAERCSVTFFGGYRTELRCRRLSV